MTMTKELWERLRDSYPETKIMLGLGVILVLLVVALWFALADADKDCVARGGHLKASTSFTYDGKTTTTYTCLSSDGRVLS